jgi:hypothetical protein
VKLVAKSLRVCILDWLVKDSLSLDHARGFEEDAGLGRVPRGESTSVRTARWRFGSPDRAEVAKCR